MGKHLPHAIPEIDHWSRPQNVNSGGKSVHSCYFCQPDRYAPMPKHCTLCARCGVFMWTGLNDPRNEALLLCRECDREVMAQLAEEGHAT